MKITQNVRKFFSRAKKGYSFFLYNTILLLNGYLVLLKPTTVLFVALLINLAVYLIFFPGLMRGHKIYLGDRKAALPFITWLWRWFIAQLCVSILFISCVLSFGHIGFLDKYIVSPQNFVLVISTYTHNQWYLFPWSLYVMWGTIIAYFSYVRNKSSSMGHAVSSFLLDVKALIGRDYVQLVVSTSVMLMCALCCISALFLLCNSITWFFKLPPHFNYPLLTIVWLSFLQIVFLVKGLRHWIKRLVLSSFTLRFFLFLELSILGVYLCISGSFNQYIIDLGKMLPPKMQLMDVFVSLMALDNRVAIFYFGWFTLMMPIIGSYFAKISQGRSFFEILSGIFVMPLFFLVISNILTTVIDNQLVIISDLFMHVILLCLSVFNFYLIAKISKNIDSTEFFSVGFFKLGNIKIYGISKVIIQIMIIMLPTTIMVLLGNWLLIGFQLGVLSLFLCYVMLIAIVVFLIDWFKNSYLVKRSL